MKTIFSSLILLVFLTIETIETAGSADRLPGIDVWEIDPEHSNVCFSIHHLGAITVTGIQKVAFKAETTINRFEFNIKWNTTTPDGIQIIDDRVNILLNLEFSKEI